MERHLLLGEAERQTPQAQPFAYVNVYRVGAHRLTLSVIDGPG